MNQLKSLARDDLGASYKVAKIIHFKIIDRLLLLIFLLMTFLPEKTKYLYLDFSLFYNDRIELISDGRVKSDK